MLLVFVAPDALVEGDYQTDLLFIDEAAAIPSSILKALHWISIPEWF
ncbi:hypothetical protein P4S73_14385 [Paraglaciecola sp. Hal342]